MLIPIRLSVQSQDAFVQAGIRATDKIEQTRPHLEIQQHRTSIMASSADSSTLTASRNPGISREDRTPGAAVKTEVDLLATELCKMSPNHSLRSIKSTIQKVSFEHMVILLFKSDGTVHLLCG